MNEVESAQAQLKELRGLIEQAKAVPMSASCMVNRADALAAVDAALAALPKDLDAAQSVVADRDHEIAQGRAEAERIRKEADEYARRAASETEVASLARQQAGELRSAAETDAAELRREADEYVERYFAEFEASLAKTAQQVRTMRTRLAERTPQRDDGA